MKSKKCLGQIILEVLVSVALFALLAFSVAVILINVLEVLITDVQKQRAIYLVKEGLEAVEAISKENFEKLTAGSYTLQIANGRWELSTEIQKEGDFFRQIKIEDQKNFEEIKKVETKIEWENPQLKDKNSLSLVKYFTNPGIFALELNSLSYLEGEPISWPGSIYTILLWVKPKDLPQDKGTGLFANQEVPQEKVPALEIIFDGISDYQLKIGGNSFFIGPLSDKWTQLAVVWDGINLKTYFNGKEKGSWSLEPNEGGVEFKKYLLGISGDKTKSFSGIYKNLMIFERALTPKEIFDLFSGKLPSLEDLRVYWKMKEGKGNVVKDFSPFNVSGNIVGQPLWEKIFTLFSLKEVPDF